MTPLDLLSIGFGGVLGAAMAVYLVGVRLEASLGSFRAEMEAYLRDRTDPDSLALGESFRAVLLDLGRLRDGLARLRRAARIR